MRRTRLRILFYELKRSTVNDVVYMIGAKSDYMLEKGGEKRKKNAVWQRFFYVGRDKSSPSFYSTRDALRYSVFSSKVHPDLKS